MRTVELVLHELVRSNKMTRALLEVRCLCSGKRNGGARGQDEGVAGAGGEDALGGGRGDEGWRLLRHSLMILPLLFGTSARGTPHTPRGQHTESPNVHRTTSIAHRDTRAARPHSSFVRVRVCVSCVSLVSTHNTEPTTHEPLYLSKPDQI